MSTQNKDRGPLPFIILAATGYDIRTCANCLSCEHLLTPEMDLTFGEVFRAASRDELQALANRTIWNCDELLDSRRVCQAELDFSSIVRVLRLEAQLRGLDEM